MSRTVATGVLEQRGTQGSIKTASPAQLTLTVLAHYGYHLDHTYSLNIPGSERGETGLSIGPQSASTCQDAKVVVTAVGGLASCTDD